MPILAGALGMFGLLVLWHLWEDHRALHILIAIEQQRQAAARPSAVPAPPASVPSGQ